MANRNTVQMMLYFDPDLDADLIAYLEPYQAKRRGSPEALRLLRAGKEVAGREVKAISRPVPTIRRTPSRMTEPKTLRQPEQRTAKPKTVRSKNPPPDGALAEAQRKAQETWGDW